MDQFDTFKHNLNTQYKEWFENHQDTEDVCKEVYNGRSIKMIQDMILRVVVDDIDGGDLMDDMKAIMKIYYYRGVINWSEIELKTVNQVKTNDQ